MESAIITSNSKAEISLLLRLARRLGIKTYRLNKEEAEDLALIHAMKTGRTGEYIDTDEYVKKLRKK